MKDLYDVLRCCKKALEEYSSLLGEDRERVFKSLLPEK